MERPAHLTIERHPFSPRRIVAISGALLLVVGALYAIEAGLRIHGFRFFPPSFQVEFYTKPPKVPHIVLPQLEFVPPPIPVVSPPEIQIEIPKPPPRIRVVRMRPHPAVQVFVQAAAPPPAPPPAPPKPRGITAPVQIGATHSCGNRYPPMAVRLNQQGTTTIRFMVNADGSVSNVQIARSSGHEMLDEAAIGCASAWRYRPALDEGRPVTAPWTTNVQWKLKNGLPA